jgi:hypothetical protein
MSPSHKRLLYIVCSKPGEREAVPTKHKLKLRIHVDIWQYSLHSRKIISPWLVPRVHFTPRQCHSATLATGERRYTLQLTPTSKLQQFQFLSDELPSSLVSPVNRGVHKLEDLRY